PAPARPRYMCPMHPQVIQNGPGACPICGMKLVPVGAHPHEGEPHGASPVPKLATVHIDPAQQQLIGLRLAAVESGPVGGRWRTIGRVTADETRVRRINVKVGGYVEQLFADFVGKAVRRGQPLLSLYSPELLSAQNEYLVARKMHQALGQDPRPDAAGNELLGATRKRLLLWDIPETALEQIERTGEPSKSLTLYSPISGVVTAKSVVEGAVLSAGDTPFEITDLSQVWVLADVYERDLSRARLGLRAELTLQAVRHETFTGVVSFIDPVLDPKTRTARVRLTFPNPRGVLRPELFGEVTFSEAPREGLRVPADAVIRSGARTVVFVSLGDGKFEPREVELGQTAGESVEVRAGLQAGERVVVRANFLVDSESRIKATLRDAEAAP
ncbi:MAG TPA: efflux RND transporter periplasmic adaptor subunit, partial [Myxococcota bacterium]|nr:efflux RND transporter periplasmic adaptor subunit [Myxococcota bacterium]